MDAIFAEHVFPRYVDRKVMKPRMNGFDDPTLRDFALLDSSVLMKEELKGEMFEDEFIRSFLNAAKELAAAGRRAIDRPGMYVMLNHSYAIPVLFLTRHCMELAIKKAIRKCGVVPKREHSLTKLWSSLLSRFPGQKCREDNRVLKSMGAFVKAVDNVDSDGTRLRYPQDNAGGLTQDRPLFVNDEEIASYLEEFVEQLELIDFDSISKVGK
ncbi:HEPN domain-containing protein [Bifidobacterium moukalabense]|uniref:HEPN domain-containing protein n=1 Tax=Bifidobacterium moukalabense TaxID=1333651 RepID=UPI0010F7EB05|nr:HEPN domain-containing protein [Bifidobacterium moukalabense]